ncbi:MAG: DNA recombination protein RmuC [Gammaproteobacteria bacterium]
MLEIAPALMASLPWLIALTVAGLVAMLLWRHVHHLRRDLEQLHASAASLQAESMASAEQLRAAKLETAQLKTFWAERSSDLEGRLTSLDSELVQARQRNTELEKMHAKLTAQLERLPEVLAELALERERLATLHARHTRLEADFAALETRSREQARAATDKLILLEQSETRLTREFENLANRIFEDKQRRFSETSKAGVETLLGPLRNQLGEFRRKVEDIYDSENKDRASLRTEILQLKTLNERISSDALNLTRALKGDSKVRGNWGEFKLERLLEQSGLSKGREYDIQASFRNEDGQRLQPDVVVHLPEGKDVVIDSKVSLIAYEQYHATEDEAGRAHHIAQHIASLRAHIQGLAAKNYDELVGVNSLDLVIMFVPIEPALLLALEHQPALYEEAFGKRILLVSPSTLMGTLQIIHNIWRYERQNRNTQEIATQAGNLHDAFVNFVDSLDKVGEALVRAQGEFETARKRLVSGRGNLVVRTHKLRQLGIKTRKSLPDALIEEAGVNDDDVTALPDAD